MSTEKAKEITKAFEDTVRELRNCGLGLPADSVAHHAHQIVDRAFSIEPLSEHFLRQTNSLEAIAASIKVIADNMEISA